MDRLPSFASGSNLKIRIGNRTLAYGGSLAFTDDVAHGSVGGVGGYSYDANEPLSYIARGNFNITLFSDLTMPYQANSNKTSLPGRVTNASQSADHDGNSFLTSNSFNPLALMLSRSFDITVYERALGTTDSDIEIFTIVGCRLGDYSLTFTPGSFVGENLGFLALQIVDVVGQPLTQAQAQSIAAA